LIRLEARQVSRITTKTKLCVSEGWVLDRCFGGIKFPYMFLINGITMAS